MNSTLLTALSVHRAPKFLNIILLVNIQRENVEQEGVARLRCPL